MRLAKALRIITQLDCELLIPVKIGFFVMVRPSAENYASLSISSHIAEKYGVSDLCLNYEANVVEVDFTGSKKQIKTIQPNWLQWSVSESDFLKTNFMLN
ncbi:hypothetical protein Phi2_0052 [Vibrio phage phi 2]|uniref:hypothetical protein n=1 Tax=Vibrio phage X29 TaxID=1500713 RepID=UPI00045FE6DE|nr:hypothetical protein SBVcX29_0018 [Vibrio phage X29]AHN84861.1 hypothetical protein Phi2_0052 [Vibrio phage phi 2]AIA10297.1 hypothetical protein SBVcX29_0018 [Vibrio phage X29]